MGECLQLIVKTGDQEGAGTDANVYVVLEDDKGVTTPKVKIDKILYNDLERCKKDTYSVDCPENFGRVTTMRLTRDDKGIADEWFCDYIHVQDLRVSKSSHSKFIHTYYDDPSLYNTTSSERDLYFFPIHRWVDQKHEYVFREFAVCLPQDDPCLGPRRSDLEAKRKSYQFIVRRPGMAAQVENLPSDENFSEEYTSSFMKEKLSLLAQTIIIEWTPNKWKTFEDLRSVYKMSLGEPKCMSVWQEDWWFGLQRLQGVDPTLITLCKNIPQNFAVTEETVSGLLEGLTLAEALEKKKLFICDLAITDGLPHTENTELASPLALFYLNCENKLMPVAIQLKQQGGHDNPVYTPKDTTNTWLVAKMFYNNAEAQQHQTLTHLAYTHLLMEGVITCTHRNLSPSHPLFKLMAPHFLFLLAVNKRALEKLLAPGGFVDNSMTQGLDGVFELVKRGFARWSFAREGQVEKDLEARGVLDKEVLPYYPYRDDAISLYQAIRKYVSTIVCHYYDSQEKVSGDWELRCWREELVKPRDKKGVGLKDIPGNDDEGFTTVEQIIDVVTSVISTCSLAHAAANFQQYEQYGFVPNYPGILFGEIPKEKKTYTEEDIMAILPNKSITLDLMVITKLLSKRVTKSLGDFEVQYLYDPVGVDAAKEFRKDLKRLSFEMKKRNVDRHWEFEWLYPEMVPNSISV